MDGDTQSMTIATTTASLVLPLLALASLGIPQEREFSERTVPSRLVHAADAVSPPLRKILGMAPKPAPSFPTTPEEWRALTAPDPSTHRLLQQMRDRFGVTVTQETIGGIPCHIVTPKTMKPEKRDRVLLGLHHGGWIFDSGEESALESIIMAGSTGYRVISVDYRTLPEHPFPAAMDDAMSVWKAVAASVNPRRVGFFGSSCGASMVLSLVQRAKLERVPLPGAVVSASPWSDMSKTGDSYYTNDGIDGVISYEGFWEKVAKLYANGHDLKDPLLSPVYGDFVGFPPTFLITGTRDLYLSNTVRVHNKLLQAGVPVQLEVGEAQPHMGFLAAVIVEAPEGVGLYSRLTRFFDTYLGL
jgi:epsilon-lactone hydrolase